MSQTDRKYDGPPMQELRHGPTPTPPPPSYRQRGKKYKGQGPIVTTDIAWRWHAKGWHWDSEKRHAKETSPFTGIARGMWGDWWMSHVIKRLKAVVKRDLRSDILWLESQATKAQISPEFSSRNGLVYWLEYTGLERGWLKVETYTYWDGERGERYKEC